MSDLNAWGLANASISEQQAAAESAVDQAWSNLRPQLVGAVTGFYREGVTPTALLRFELVLVSIVRELARVLLEAALNSLEPTDPLGLPRDLMFECGGYRRRNQKTRNAFVATLFGTVTLCRCGYRAWDAGDKSIFPLEMLLGFNCGASPGLVDWLGREMAKAGATQDRVLETLREERGVAMGVKRLRQIADEVSRGIEEFRQTHQVSALLDALEQARDSRGNRKPVLAVGRDGITLREYKHRCFEVATAATVSVYDRAGKRLITVYLAWPPQPGQATMDGMLTGLLNELLGRWQGPLPRLAYVSDAGSSESGYYENCLRRMRHPCSGARLHWVRVVDYYHTSERIWTMASLMYGEGTRAASAWAVRMLKNLKKPNGPSRVLHSAAVHFRRQEKTLSKKHIKDFWKAYRYLQSRTRFLRYHEYASHHIPLGSGVTEAACKTIFTQRLKLSGMRWSNQGARMILTLRVVVLSGTWRPTYEAYLKSRESCQIRAYAAAREIPVKNAA